MKKLISFLFALILLVVVEGEGLGKNYLVAISNGDGFTQVMREVENGFIAAGIVAAENTVFLGDCSRGDIESAVRTLSSRANEQDVLIVPWLAHGAGYWAEHKLLFTRPEVLTWEQATYSKASFIYDAREDSLAISANFIQGWQDKDSSLGLDISMIESLGQKTWTDSIKHYAFRLSAIKFVPLEGTIAPIYKVAYATVGDRDGDGWITNPGRTEEILDLDCSRVLIDSVRWGMNMDVDHDGRPDQIFAVMTPDGPRLAVDFNNPDSTLSSVVVDGIDEDNDGILDWADLNGDGQLNGLVIYHGAYQLADGLIYDNEIGQLFESWPGYTVFISGVCYGTQILDHFRGDRIIAFADGERHGLSDLSFFSSAMKYDALWKYMKGGGKDDSWLDFLNGLAKKRWSSFLNDNGDLEISKWPWSGSGDGYLASQIKLFPREETTPPEVFSINQSYPNPFNEATRINFTVAESFPIRLVVYNIIGEEVAVLFEGVKEAGEYEMAWNGNDQFGRPLPSGAYFYRLEAGWRGWLISKKITIIR